MSERNPSHIDAFVFNALENIAKRKECEEQICYYSIMSALLFLWQLPQNILGFILSRRALCYGKGRDRFYIWRRNGSISLGNYIIVDDIRSLEHERAHSVQSRMLGPLYLLIIGLPSLVWCALHSYTRLRRLDYFSFYTEAWAERIRKGS